MSGSDSTLSTIDATKKILSQIQEDTGVTLELPNVVTNANLKTLEPKWVTDSEAAARLIIDASEVHEISDKGVDVISMLVTGARDRGAIAVFDPPPSDEFLQRVESLGLTNKLDL